MSRLPLPLRRESAIGDASAGVRLYSEMAPPDQVKKWLEIFRQFDRDSGGDVDLRELGVMFRHLGQTVRTRSGSNGWRRASLRSTVAAACIARRFVMLCWRAAGAADHGTTPWFLATFIAPISTKYGWIHKTMQLHCRGGIALQLRTAGATNTSFESDRYTR